MSTLATNAITDASGGNTTSINGYTPTESNMAGRNRIINGDMRIDQRNAGASVTPSIQSATYITDRFYFLQNSSTLPSIQQSTDAPEGFTNSLLFTNTSTGTTPAYAQVVQNIEGHNTADLGWGTANAQAITASFRVKSSLTGTFSVAFRNASVNRSYVTTYTISAPNTWETKTVTVPGDTSGTWLTNNGTGISFIFGLGASSGTSTVDQWTNSSDYYLSGSVNVMGTANATWQITGVQLEAGSVATPFEHRQYGQELALCQRYYQTWGGVTANDFMPYFGIGYNSSTLEGVLTFIQQMRSPPSLSVVGSFIFLDIGATYNTGTLILDVVGLQTARIRTTTSSGLTQYRPYILLANGAASRLQLSAEL
jgi:hypothetical protein